MSAEKLKSQWKSEGKKAIDRGNLVHDFSEKYLQGEIDIVPGFNLSPVIKNTQKICDILLSKFKYLESEKLVFSPNTGLAGKIDLLMQKSPQHLVVVDWKSNKEIKFKNPWQFGFKPINHLPDCNFSHYSLQLGIYQYILEAEKYFPEVMEIQRLLIHVGEENETPYKISYLKNEIEQMLFGDI